MFKAARWRNKNIKIKAVFKLQFRATQVPQLGWDSLMVSLVPVDIGKPTVKSAKAAIHEGNCQWETPIYETVRFIKESKSGKIKKKMYQFLILTESVKAGLLGEVTVDFAEYAEAIKPCSISLALKASNSGTVLHVTIQRIRAVAVADGREMEENGDVMAGLQGTTLRSQLSNCDSDDNYNDSNDSRNFNSTEDSSSVTGTLQSSLSFDKATSQHAESDGIPKTSSCSDSISASNGSSGQAISQELGFKTNNVSLTLSVGNSATAQKQNASADSVAKCKEHQSLNRDWLFSSAIDGSLDYLINSSEDTLLKGSLQALDVSTEKPKNEMVLSTRQAEVSELELQTLRKRVVKESGKVQDLLQEVYKLKEEKDRLKRECERLQASQPEIDGGNILNGLKFKTDESRYMVEDFERKLNYEKELNTNLQLQLQKTQESNSKLILTVKDLEQLLEKKNDDTQSMKFANDDLLLLQSAISRADDGMSISNIENSLERKVVDLWSEIEVHKRERDDLEMQMEQLALEYEILKQENHVMSLKLEQTQLQLQLMIQDECSVHLDVISNLEAHVARLENELEKCAEAFEDDLTAMVHAKVEQEQRAIRAEEALRKTRRKNADMAEHLQEEFSRLAMQMSDAFDANERRVMEAVTEANELHLQKIHQEDLLEKTNEELRLMKDQYEEKLKNLSDQLDFERKQTDRLRFEFEDKCKELERLNKFKGAGQKALLEEITKLQTKIERLEQDKSYLSQQASEEAEKMLKEINDLAHIKDETEKMVGSIQLEMANLQGEYDELKNSLLKDGLEKDNLRKQMHELRSELQKEDMIVAVEEIGQIEMNDGANDENAVLPNSFGDGRNKAEDLPELEKGAEMCIPDQNDNVKELLRSADKGLKLSVGDNQDPAHPAELLREMALLKERNKCMECGLKEMQDRYSEISLKLAEVEGERQQLVIAVRNLKHRNRE